MKLTRVCRRSERAAGSLFNVSLPAVAIIAAGILCAATSANAAEMQGNAGNVAYVIAGGGLTPSAAKTDGSIVQLRQNPDGRLVETSAPRAKVGAGPGYCLVAATPRRFYVAVAGIGLAPGPVWQYGIGPTGDVTSLSPAAVPGLRANEMAIAPNGRLLFAAGTLDNTIVTFSVKANGALQRVSSWRLPATAASSGEPPTNPGNDPIYLANLATDGSGSFLYALEFRPLGASTILQFRISSSGSLIPLVPFPIQGVDWPLLIADHANSLVYAENSGSIAPFSVGSDGRLRPLAPAVAASSKDRNPDGARAGSEPLLQIYPAPQTKAPPLDIERCVLDTAHPLMFGVSKAGNEIDVWRTRKSGTPTLVHRSWFDESGTFPRSDPRATKTDMSAPNLQLFIDPQGTYLYLIRDTVDVASQTVRSRLFCFKIDQAGELQMVSSNLNVGVDLDKEYLANMVVFKP